MFERIKKDLRGQRFANVDALINQIRTVVGQIHLSNLEPHSADIADAFRAA